MEKLTEEQIQKRLDDAILKADPNKLTNEELSRRVYLRENMPPSVIERTVGAGKDVLSMAGKVIDYPSGILRTTVNAGVDLIKGDKNLEEGIDSVKESLYGPSNATTPQQLAENVGFSKEPISAGNFKPFGDIPASAIGGAGLDLITSAVVAPLAYKAAKAVPRLGKMLLGDEDLALSAMGIKARDLKKEIGAADAGESFLKKNELSKYGEDNVLKALSGTEATLDRAKLKLDKVGSEIGMLRKRNEKKVDQFLLNNVDHNQVADYLGNTFKPALVSSKIDMRLADDIVDADFANQVQSLVDKKLSAIAERYGDEPLDIEKIGKLKSEWQKEINYGKDSADFSVREKAFQYLQQEANKAIANELAFADKIYSGNDLAKHKKLSQEYGMLNKIHDGLTQKAARESTQSVVLNPLSGTIGSTRLTSAGARLLPSDLSASPITKNVMAGVGEAGNIINMGKGMYKEPTLESFPIGMTQPVGPNDYSSIKTSIEQNPSLSNVEKAKRMNLLNKHARAYIGQ